jgi:lipopolysaccharide/colanic/teichoic acid biosynthesis glycosyltransferase
MAAVRRELGGDLKAYGRLLQGLSLFVRRRLRRLDHKGWLDATHLGVLMPETPEIGGRVVLARLTRWLGSYLEAEEVLLLPENFFKLAVYPDSVRDACVQGGQPGSGAYAPEPRPPEAMLCRGFSRGAAECLAKRLLDVVVSALLLVLFSPLMAVLAAAVRLTSPGPALFRQVRVGEGGRPFVFYKFRSMYVGRDDSAHREYTRQLIEGEVEKINNGNGDKLVLKMASDPRVTPLGRFMRRASLDELPQLWNVLRGDMSLVGPRPPIPYEVKHYQDWHLRRILAVRPGISGLWQVGARSSSSFNDMVRLDIRYADTWSLGLDLKILLKTVGAVVSAKGAY